MSNITVKPRFIVVALILAAAVVAAVLLVVNSGNPGAHRPAPPAADAAANQPPQTSDNKQPQPEKNEPAPEPVEEANYDVVMIGSELEGMYLANTAAEQGLSVLILDPRAKPGGQLLQAEMLFLDEPKDENRKSLVQGKIKELFTKFKSGTIRKLPQFQSYFDSLRQGVQLESDIRIEAVDSAASEKSGQSHIRSVTYRNAAGKLKKANAAYWVENSDFAALSSRLNVTRIPGIETIYGLRKPEFMGATYIMKFRNVDWKKFREMDGHGGNVNESFAVGYKSATEKYKAQNSDLVFLRGLNALYQGDGEVLINALLVYGVDPADDASVKEAMKLGQNEMPYILDLFRRNLKGWEKAELNGSADYLYIREYNRFETDYVLQASDLFSARMFWDNVSIGGYPMDLQGTKDVKYGKEMGRPDKYGIPLRSFLLKNYDNVIVAGKNVGAAEIAYGSARIQANTSLAAESIGVLLKQIDGVKGLKDVNEDDMNKLHSALESKYGIKLRGVTGTNKIAGWSEDEMAKLNAGKIEQATYKRSKSMAK